MGVGDALVLILVGGTFAVWIVDAFLDRDK
jgi:hypothetical protein